MRVVVAVLSAGLTLLVVSIGLELRPQTKAPDPTPRAGAQAPAVGRVVSMNPSLTAILVAPGAVDLLVGVDDFSARQEPAAASLPRVGGLYSPSLESVVSLDPDLVLLVPSFEQRAFRERLDELGISVLGLDPLSLDDVLDSILVIGRRLDREPEARARVAAIRATREAVELSARTRARPRAVLVLQRDPLFVAGPGSFLDDMLRAAGAENLGAALTEPYPRASMEWLVGAAPTVILDSAPDAEQAPGFWARWPSIPAVADGRVVPLASGLVTLPGPHLDRAMRTLAQALHDPEALAEREPPR